MNKELPELTPINLKAYFYNNFGACGCSELDEMLATVTSLLAWHDEPMEKRPRYNELYDGNTGIFYLLAGLLDNLGLVEHGYSIRNPWLTVEGMDLLEALRKTSYEEIEEASGEAYDGLRYGN